MGSLRSNTFSLITFKFHVEVKIVVEVKVQQFESLWDELNEEEEEMNGKKKK